MTEQKDDNFVQRHNALVAAIEARPDALAEDHLIYAEFLLSGERTLEALTGEVEGDTEDPRVQAWYRIADHPLFLECFNSEGSFINAIIRRMDELHAAESQKVVSSTPAYLVGVKVREEHDHTYPVGAHAQDEDNDRWLKRSDGWECLTDATGLGPWDYNAVFIA